MRKEGD
ncbi:hypothetical protein L345_05693, partial [Ophiophagus hannah]